MIEYILSFVAITLLFKFILNLRHNSDDFIKEWPIIGTLPAVLHNMSNLHDYVTQCLKHYGGTFWLKGPLFTNSDYIVTSDPMNVHHILSKNHGNYGKGSNFNEIFEHFGGSIFNSDFNEWKWQRTLLHSLLSRKSFLTFLEQTIQKKLQNSLLPFLDHASKAEAYVDLQDVFERFTLDTTCTNLFGFDPKSLPNKGTELPEIPLLQNVIEIEETLLYRNFIPKWSWKLLNRLQIGQEKKYNIAKEKYEQFLHERIQDSKCEVNRRCGNTNEVDESQLDLMKTIMIELAEKGEEIDDKFFRDTAFTLLSAGNSTISSGLSWFFWLVSTHPNVEDKIIQEIKDNSPSDKMVDKLVYLHGAISEALRLYPPVPFEHKCAKKSDILPSGEHVSPNTKILYVLYSMGRMEEIWGEDCMEFKPERWISERGHVIHVPSYKFIAFNAGPRSCLGKDITLIQMKMVAIAILSKFHIKVVKGHPIIPTISIILSMKHGLKVKVTKRCI